MDNEVSSISHQVLRLISDDQDGGGPSAQVVLFMLLSVAAAGPCPSFVPLVASLRILQDRPLRLLARPAQAIGSQTAVEPESVQVSEPKGAAALWLLAGKGARAAIPALRVAAQAGACAEGLAGLDVTGGHQGWKESVEAGKEVWDAIGRCRHRCWQGLFEGLNVGAAGAATVCL